MTPIYEVQPLMTTLQKLLVISTALCALAFAATARAQDSGSNQAPLGDVVRQQREQRQHSKTAKKVVTDEDIPANRMRWTRDQVAEFLIIPAVQISGTIPNDSTTSKGTGLKHDKLTVWFGPHLGQDEACYGPDCAADAFLRKFQKGQWTGSRARILFDSDDTVDSYQARIAHFEVVHDVHGKWQGVVALIATPVATLAAACMYDFDDWAEAAPECDAFISSLQVKVPDRYIYVQH